MTEQAPRRQRPRRHIAAEQALNVLVINDTPKDRMAVRFALEAGGFVLQEAADAEHGLKLAQFLTPDCILLDSVLPDVGGLEALESLRKPSGMLPCAVVMLTGAGTADFGAAAMKVGALDCLDKDGLDADRLRRAIHDAVRKFRSTEAQRVAEQRKAELAELVDASGDAIISVGADLAVQTWNAAAQRLFGYSEAEARGRTAAELIVPDVYEAERADIYEAAISSGTRVVRETVRRHKDGRLIPVEMAISPIRDSLGRVTRLSVMFRDISERQRAEDVQRRHTERQALLLELTADLLCASTPGELGRLAFERIRSGFGTDFCLNYRLPPDRDGAQHLRLVFGHGIPPDWLEAASCVALGQPFCQQVVAEAQCIGCEPNAGFMRGFGPMAQGCEPQAALARSFGLTACACYPLVASDGRVLGTFSVGSKTRAGFTDEEIVWLGTAANFLAQAWERLEAEERNAQLGAIVAASDDAIISIGTNLVVRTWNAGAQRLLGYSEAEACGRSITELVIPDAHYEAERSAMCATAVRCRRAVRKETVRRHKDGRLIPVETSVSPILDGPREVIGFSLILRDISERRRAEEAQLRYIERQRLLLEVTSDLIRASGPGELGRVTFEHIRPAFNADACFNFRFDPVQKRLKLVFMHGVPQEHLQAIQTLELGQAYCGTVAASGEPVMADAQSIACEPNAALVRSFGITAYACRPLKAADGRVLGTFSVGTKSRDRFTEEEVAWLGTVTNFLAQAWERFEAEQGLRDSDECLRLSHEAAGLGSWEYNFDSGTSLWSEQARKLLGAQPTEPASLPLLLSRVHPEDRPRVEEQIARRSGFDLDHVYHAEFRIILQNGTVRWLEDQGRVETDAAGRPVRAFGVIRDITARKNAEEVQERLAAVVTSSADAIVSKTRNGIVTSWNEGAELMFGYPAGEMIGQSIRRLIPADREPEEDMILARLARGERIEHYETVRVAKDGHTIDVSITVSPLRDDSGRIIGASKIVRDITERKQADRLLRRQADLLDQSHDAIFTWKLGGGIAYWNRGAELLYGYTAEEAIGQISHDLLRTRSPMPMQEIEAQIGREGSWYGELTHTTHDGRTIVVESRHVRVCYDGETYALETNRDITARKQADAERQKFMSLADRSTEFIGMCDVKFKPFYVNEAGRRLVGLNSLEQACATPVQDFFFPEDRDYITNQFFPKVLRQGRAEVEIRFRHFKTGAALWMIYNVFGVHGEAGQLVGYATVSRDITARKRAEAQLVEREAQLALFVKHAPAAIAMFDDKMRYLAVSRRFISDYRLPADAEIIGRSYYEVFPETPLRWREIHARVLAGEELSHEEDPFPRHDGHIDRVQWSMKPWRTADGQIGGAMLFSQFMTRALAEREARFQATFENAAVGIAHVAPDGRWLRVNEALCRILDYPADELVTRSFQDVIHPDDLAVDFTDRRRMLEGEIDKYAADKRFLRKDGSIVWVRLTVGRVRESGGSIDYLVCAVEDISARKHAEEQIHFLMREVNHRAKNMLGLVQAIARQTAAREPEDFVARFSQRLQALAANQDLLVRNQWHGIDAEDLAHAQLAHFADLVGSRIVLNGPKLRLNAAAAQAIGLALHELATNAGKYGALSVDAGRVDLQWRHEGGLFTISWTERNGPTVSPPQRRGFGSTVVGSMAKLSVGGEVELDYAPSGLEWRLTCPAANALEPAEAEQRSHEGKFRIDGGNWQSVEERSTPLPH